MSKADMRQAAIAQEARSMLFDSRYDSWRSAGRRRVLVIASVLAIVFTCIASVTDNPILLLPTLGVAGGCWWVLRKVVRGMADLPDDFIDERIQAVRNEHYLYAYRILCGVLCLVLIAFYMAADARQIQWQPGANHLHALFWGTLLSSAMLPSMLLAWTQREI